MNERGSEFDLGDLVALKDVPTKDYANYRIVSVCHITDCVLPRYECRRPDGSVVMISEGELSEYTND